MTPEELRKAAEVMLYKAEHPDAVVEAKVRHECSTWQTVNDGWWDWYMYDYRIKPAPREFWVNEYSFGFGDLVARPDIAKNANWDSRYIRTIHLREVVE